MVIEIFIPDKLVPPDANKLAKFLQMMANRRVVGHLRYERGKPNTQPMKWLERLRACLKVYREDGNGEHLLDAAVYAYREFIEPRHRKFHFNPFATSVTRRDSRRADRGIGE